MICSVPKLASSAPAQTLSVFLTRSVFDWQPGLVLSGIASPAASDEPMMIRFGQFVWIGQVRVEGADLLKVFPEIGTPFYVRSEDVELFRIESAPTLPALRYECDVSGATLETSPALDALFQLTSREMEGVGWLRHVGRTQAEKYAIGAHWFEAANLRRLYCASYVIHNPDTGLAVPCATTATIVTRGGKPVYRGVVIPL